MLSLIGKLNITIIGWDIKGYMPGNRIKWSFDEKLLFSLRNMQKRF
jgi:hypothetical protein